MTPSRLTPCSHVSNHRGKITSLCRRGERSERIARVPLSSNVPNGSELRHRGRQPTGLPFIGQSSPPMNVAFVKLEDKLDQRPAATSCCGKLTLRQGVMIGCVYYICRMLINVALPILAATGSGVSSHKQFAVGEGVIYGCFWIVKTARRRTPPHLCLRSPRPGLPQLLLRRWQPVRGCERVFRTHGSAPTWDPSRHLRGRRLHERRQVTTEPPLFAYDFDVFLS